ncbi:winged helix-turn-helix domain-containing protein [Paenibacillus dendritiformis]|uniref:winged helix-turn-helix domain-containing protein n=1 Tax=Paenibacillus dendritiformis TaxID=130049 RepID=UPI00387E1134
MKPGQIISTKQLIKHTWMASSINHLFDRQELYVYINRLRKKMEDDPKKPKHLVTIKSVGYVLYAKSFK